jgi:protein tyrosine/serine phosphatase
MILKPNIMTYRALKFSTAAIVLSAASLAFAADQAAGVPNFHTVNETLYRGGQPTGEGFKSLSKIGVKTVIDLRNEGKDAQAEEKLVTAAGMKYVSIHLNGMEAPSDANLSKVLKIFNDSSAGPVFVHCRRGCDRTGTVVACYRITHDHWDNAKALTEARSLGMAWIERAMQNFVKHYKAPTEVAAGDAALAR